MPRTSTRAKARSSAFSLTRLLAKHNGVLSSPVVAPVTAEFVTISRAVHDALRQPDRRLLKRDQEGPTPWRLAPAVPHRHSLRHRGPCRDRRCRARRAVGDLAGAAVAAAGATVERGRRRQPWRPGAESRRPPEPAGPHRRRRHDVRRPGGRVVASTLGTGSRGVDSRRCSRVVHGRQRASRMSSAVVATDCGCPCLVAYRAVEGRQGTSVALVADTSELDVRRRSAVTRAIVLGAALSAVVMVLVGQAVARRVTAPLDRLVRFARELSPQDSQPEGAGRRRRDRRAGGSVQRHARPAGSIAGGARPVREAGARRSVRRAGGPRHPEPAVVDQDADAAAAGAPAGRRRRPGDR